ncbi:pullulanase-associated domain-containing protein [Agarivorans sp. MS3-6]
MKRTSTYLLLLCCLSGISKAANVNTHCGSLKCNPGDRSSSATMSIHFKPLGNKKDNWGLHIWPSNDTNASQNTPAKADFRLRQATSLTSLLTPSATDAFGLTFTIPLRRNAKQFSYVLSDGKKFHADVKEWKWVKDKQGLEIWVIENDPAIYTSQPSVAIVQAALTHFNKTSTVSRSAKSEEPVKATAKATNKAKSTNTSNALISGQLKQLEQQLVNRTNSISALQSSLNSAQKTTRQLNSQLSNKHKEYLALAERNEKIRQDSSNLTQSNKNLSNQINKQFTSEDKQRLQTRNNELEEHIIRLAAQIAGLKKTLTNTPAGPERNKQIQQQLDSLVEQREQLRAEGNKLSAQILALVQQPIEQQPFSLKLLPVWALVAIVVILICLIIGLFILTNRHYRTLKLSMTEALKKKQQELEQEKNYASTANAKLRKVLHGQVKESSWSDNTTSIGIHKETV